MEKLEICVSLKCGLLAQSFQPRYILDPDSNSLKCAGSRRLKTNRDGFTNLLVAGWSCKKNSLLFDSFVSHFSLVNWEKISLEKVVSLRKSSLHNHWPVLSTFSKSTPQHSHFTLVIQDRCYVQLDPEAYIDRVQWTTTKYTVNCKLKAANTTPSTEA